MIEEKPFSSCLTPENPTLAYLETAAAYAKNMPSELRDAILNSPSEAKLIEYMDSSLETRALVRTSTAVDIVCGGEKGMSFFTVDISPYADIARSKCSARDSGGSCKPSNRH